jgi:tRNA A-37 threonylcarbamoyl transferase component Bud32
MVAAQYICLAQLKTSDRVSALTRQDQYVSGEQIVAWGRELAAELRAIYDKGILHMDVKTANVIMSTSELRLIDFDLAQESAGAKLHSGICVLS